MLRGFVNTVLLALTLSLFVAPLALAQDASPPSPPATSPVFIDPLDPRAGEGASQVGAPLLALVAVVALGCAAAALTFLYVRVVRSR